MALESSVEWVKYTSEAGRYSALFPKQPIIGTQEGNAKTGEKLIQHIFQATDADSFYMVAYFDLTAGMVFSLDDGRDGMLQAVKGTLLIEEVISLGGKTRARKLRSRQKIETPTCFSAPDFTPSGSAYMSFNTATESHLTHH